MKTIYALLLTLAMSMVSFSLFSQGENEGDENLLNLPGDNLDLYVVLDLFQKSPSIEDFEDALNNPEKAINNLDLTLDDNIDFIKVLTQQNDDDFIFVLQVDITEKEVQDVAAIFVSKDKSGKVGLQIVGDEALYGKNYVVEPNPTPVKVTPNPAYSGSEVVEAQSATTVVVVESAPIVHYVYSPVYVPYYPPYYYGYYPPYYRPVPVVSVHFYFSHHSHYHNHHYHHYHGGRGGNTVIINKNYNNYNRTRKSSTVVLSNTSNGTYAKRNNTVIVNKNKTIVNRNTTITRSSRTTNVSTRSTPQTSSRSTPSTSVRSTRSTVSSGTTPTRSSSTSSVKSSTRQSSSSQVKTQRSSSSR